MNRCKSCRYFVELQEDNHMFVNEGDGICKRYPKPISAYVDSWCGEHKRHPVAKKDKPKTPGAGDVIAYYCETFKDKFNVNPTIGGKDSGSVVRMLKEHTVAEINQHIMEFFSDTPMFYKDNNMYGLNHVESAWDKMVIKRVKMGENTGDELTYETMLNEQVIAWANHEKWVEYQQFIMDTRELILFEDWLKEYYEDDDAEDGVFL